MSCIGQGTQRFARDRFHENPAPVQAAENAVVGLMSEVKFAKRSDYKPLAEV